jgi:hypothetical protein
MTLVAAFAIEGVPVMLGDLLITDEPSGLPHQFLPTRPDLSNASAKERRRIGVRRKVLVLGDRLIIGFTGSVAAGSILFQELHRQFCKKTPSSDELSFALRLHNIQLSGIASVVGWLADPQPRCFTWSAKAGAQLQWCTHAVLGSGAKHFSRSILSADHVGHSKNFTPAEFARFVAITKATRVLGDELGPAGTLKNAYGYCLEVATWSGETFEFEPSLTFSFFNALIGPGHSNRIQPVLVRIYRHHDRFSIVQTAFLGDTVGPDGSVGKHVYVDYATGLHDDCDDVAFPKATLDPNAPVFCFGIAWSDCESKKTGLVNLTVDASEVQIQDDKQRFNLQLRDSSWLFKSIREFIASSQKG